MWFSKTCLPQNDNDLKCREKSLTRKRSDYRYNYNVIPGLGIIDKIPKTEYPRLLWVWKTLQAGVELLRNAIASRENKTWSVRRILLPELFRIRMIIRLVGLIFSGDATNFFVAGGTYIAKFLKPGEGVSLQD